MALACKTFAAQPEIVREPTSDSKPFSIVHAELLRPFAAFTSGTIKQHFVERALDRLSFTGTLHRLRTAWLLLVFHSRRCAAELARLSIQLLAWITSNPVPHRPNRFEPRCRKSRPKEYGLLQIRHRPTTASNGSLPLWCKPNGAGYKTPKLWQDKNLRQNGIGKTKPNQRQLHIKVPLCLVRDRGVEYGGLVRPTIPTSRRVPAIIRTNQPSPDLFPQGERDFQAHPLGPFVFEAEAARPRVARTLSAAVLVGCVLLFAVASRLKPATGGIGTHEQSGLPPCGMMMLWGVPCPTCGMTTAFAYAARGRLASAFHAQPAGLALAIAIGLAAIAAGGTLVTGRTYRVNWFRLSPTRGGFAVVALLLGAWVYKIVTTLVGTIR